MNVYHVAPCASKPKDARGIQGIIRRARTRISVHLTGFSEDQTVDKEVPGYFLLDKDKTVS